MNYSYFEGNKIVVKEVIDMANTLPFFAEKRLIIIENSGFFKSSQERTGRFYKNMPDYLILFLLNRKLISEIKYTRQSARQDISVK